MTKRIFSLVLVMAMVLMLVPHASAAYTKYVYTENGKSLNVRGSESVGNNIVGSLRYGTAVTVLQEYAGWAQIEFFFQLPDGTPGARAFVMSRYLVNNPPAPLNSGRTVSSSSAPASAAPAAADAAADAAKVLSQMNAEFASARKVNPFTVVARPSRASGWVNLRWAPSTEAARITTCPQGKELTVLAVLKTWYQVEDPATGMIGFISSKYVTQK